jgi:predicted nuclease of predicted toxin-antitoxin system
MKLFADENIARGIVLQLREQGHDVASAAEIQPRVADSDWLSRAEAEGRIILTSDKDFGTLIFRSRQSSHGVVLLRLGDMPLQDRLALLQKTWQSALAQAIGNFVVIAPGKIRVRNLIT